MIFVYCVKCLENIDDDSVYCKWCGKKQVKTAAAKTLKRANGTGTVYKLSGRRRKPWALVIGKKYVGFYAEKTEAVKVMESISSKGLPEKYNDSLADVYERWQDSHFRDLTVKGREGYEMAWKRLSPLHDSKIRNIKTADFQRLIDVAVTQTKDPSKAKPLSRSGKEKIKQLCSQLCKQAIQDEIINRNYGEYLKLDKEERKEKDIFSSEDIRKLFSDYSQTAKIIIVLIYTGMRLNELFYMKHSSVNILERYMVGGEKTEAGKNRVIPINNKILPIIQEWHSLNGFYLISNSSGNPINSTNFRNRDYYPLLEKLGISKKNPHSTRHTFASLMSSAGVRPEILQKIIGHSNFSTTANIYIHPDVSEYIKAIDML